MLSPLTLIDLPHKFHTHYRAAVRGRNDIYILKNEIERLLMLWDHQSMSNFCPFPTVINDLEGGGIFFLEVGGGNKNVSGRNEGEVCSERKWDEIPKHKYLDPVHAHTILFTEVAVCQLHFN